MKRLDTVVKLTRQRLQERRRELSEIEALDADLRHQVIAIDAALNDEGAQVGQSVDAAASFSRFLSASLSRKRTLLLSLREIAAEKRAAEEQVMEAFRDLKKFETILERQTADTKAAGKRREQRDLDEVGRTLKHIHAVRGL